MREVMKERLRFMFWAICFGARLVVFIDSLAIIGINLMFLFLVPARFYDWKDLTFYLLVALATNPWSD